MAKKKKLTDEQVLAAVPTLEHVVVGRLRRLGAAKAAGKFAGDKRAKQRTARKFYQQFVDDGGKVGDWQTFLTWLLEHSDEIIAFISKLIALFSV